MNSSIHLLSFRSPVAGGAVILILSIGGSNVVMETRSLPRGDVQ